MSEEIHFPAYHERRRELWIAWMVGGIAALVLGIMGYWGQTPELAETPALTASASHASSLAAGLERFSSAAYSAIRLFFLDSPETKDPPGICLHLARWLAALFTLIPIGYAFERIYRSDIWYLLFRNRTGHVVICGSGWQGVALASKFKNETKLDVVVIEKDEKSPGLEECDKKGIAHFVGDATLQKMLIMVNAKEACTLIAVCGDDGVNMDVAKCAEDLAVNRQAEDNLTIFMHIENRDLRDTLRAADATPRSSRAEVSTSRIDIFENIARTFFRDHKLDREMISKESHLQVHLVIIGFSEIGEAMLLQAVRIGHFANNHRRKLRVTVLDPAAKSKEKSFRERYPRMGDIYDLDLEFSDSPFHSSHAVDIVVASHCDPNTLMTCVICYDDHMRNLSSADRIFRAIKVKETASAASTSISIGWWLGGSTSRGISYLRQNQARLFDDSIFPFGSLEDMFDLNDLANNAKDDIAKAFHESYCEKQRAAGDTLEKNPSLAVWDVLPESMRESNRLAADHIDVKLRAIGYTKTKSKDSREKSLDAFTSEHLAILMPMEHARYCAERFVDGWRYGPERNKLEKINPTLIPWDQLVKQSDPVAQQNADKERQKDRDQVALIPELLKHPGYYIVRP